MPTSYSTLEEAWGVTNNKKKKSKSKECELYDRKSSEVSKPFKKKISSKEATKYKNMMLLDEDEYDEDYEKYFGYHDSRRFSRSSEPRPGHRKNHQISKKKNLKIDPVNNTYDSDFEEEMIEEEEYEDEVPFVFEEEDDDNYLSQRVAEKRPLRRRRQYKMLPPPAEEDEYESSEDIKPIVKSSKDSVDIDNILDLSIYTLSGIILIFILEQFVQLGIKLRSFKN